MLWEQRCSVPVRTHAKQNEIEHGETRGILLGEFADKLGLVSVCYILIHLFEFLRIGNSVEFLEELWIEGMDCGEERVAGILLE
jgi:hypothetical protein